MTRKILHMHFGKEGGAERFFVNLVEGFQERGLDQRFVIRPDRLWRDEVAQLGPVYENNFRQISLSRLIFTRKINRIIRDWQPDVIMAWMSRASKLMPHESNAVRLTRLGDYPRHLKNFQNNDHIVSNVPGIAEACTALGWDRGLHVISNFVRDVDIRPVQRRDMDTPDDAFLVVGSGRFVGRKGFDTLVRAIARVPDAYLWLVGDGPDRGMLQAKVVELGLVDRVRFAGWVDEAMHYVAAGDLFVMPSRHEPLGNVILESWKAGVPVVTTRSEGPTWFVEDEKDALMVDIDDAEGMAAAIERIRTRPALGQSMAQAGAAKLAESFTRDRILDQYLSLFAGRDP